MIIVKIIDVNVKTDLEMESTIVNIFGFIVLKVNKSHILKDLSKLFI